MTVTETAEFDLHGLAGVRIVGGGPADVRAIERQLGPLPRSLDREPDITIRFVDRVADPTRLRYLGAREAGWTDEGFYVLKSRKRSVVVRIPMDRIGGQARSSANRVCRPCRS